MGLHLVPFLIGAAVGSVMTYIYKDKASQKKIKDVTQDASDKVKAAAQDSSDKVKSAAQDASKKVKSFVKPDKVDEE
ncbi:MAG: YtxH domain-containing protein [gamma proteobacterium symbiont of Taylorina sp.]|nr:YtxH domain-containing protein [gamma proteobacterium symbiont of Taylorina sp.]